MEGRDYRAASSTRDSTTDAAVRGSGAGATHERSALRNVLFEVARAGMRLDRREPSRQAERARSPDHLEIDAAAASPCGGSPRVRVVVVTGAGEKAFVAGADIEEMSPHDPAAKPRSSPARSRRALSRIERVAEAGARGGQRIRSRRWVRARTRLPPAHRRRHGALRAAGGRLGPHSGRRRHAAAPAAGRTRPRPRAGSCPAR